MPLFCPLRFPRTWLYSRRRCIQLPLPHSPFHSTFQELTLEHPHLHSLHSQPLRLPPLQTHFLSPLPHPPCATPASSTSTATASNPRISSPARTTIPPPAATSSSSPASPPSNLNSTPLHELAEAIRVDKSRPGQEIHGIHQALQVEFRRLALRNLEVEGSVPRGAEEVEERRVEHAALREEMGRVRGLMEDVGAMMVKQEALGRLGKEEGGGKYRRG